MSKKPPQYRESLRYHIQCRVALAFIGLDPVVEITYLAPAGGPLFFSTAKSIFHHTVLSPREIMRQVGLIISSEDGRLSADDWDDTLAQIEAIHAQAQQLSRLMAL